MWLAPVAQLLAVAAMAPQAGPDSPISTETLPKPIATRQTVFAIPFRIDRPDQPSQEPVEVQLYVSDDLGTTWQLCEKVEPARGQFVFRARDDREYWFAIRTLDRSGRLRPEETGCARVAGGG